MSILTTETLSAQGDRWIRRATVGLIVIVACCSFMLSFSGLVYLAVQSGIHQGLAWILPMCIDGMMLLGSFEILHASLQRRKTMYGNLLVLFGVCLSVWGNIQSAGASGQGVSAQVVHAIGPVSLYLSVEVGVRTLKNRIAISHEATAEAMRKAEREAKRQQKAMEQAQRKPASVKAEPSRAQGKVTAHDAVNDVAAYRAVIDGMDPETSKASRIEAVLRQFPEAKSGHVAQALGVELKTVGTTIVRVRERLASEKGVSASDADFHELVKELAPVGER